MGSMGCTALTQGGWWAEIGWSEIWSLMWSSDVVRDRVCVAHKLVTLVLPEDPWELNILKSQVIKVTNCYPSQLENDLVVVFVLF